MPKSMRERFQQLEIAPVAAVCRVAEDKRRKLFERKRCRSGVREQVSTLEHLRGKLEDIPPCLDSRFPPLFDRKEMVGADKSIDMRARSMGSRKLRQAEFS